MIPFASAILYKRIASAIRYKKHEPNILELFECTLVILSESIAKRVRNKKSWNELTDGDLLRLSCGGDEEAFLILYRRHEGSVFRFALHMSGSRETAEEVTQEVFLAMLTEAKQYSVERGSLQAYLIGVARNQVRRQFRNDRFASYSDGAANEMLSANQADSFIEEAGRDRELSLLRTAILSLPPNYREVVVLCDLEGVEYAEAASRLKCAVGTVRSRLHRARSILEAKMRRSERCPV